MATFPRAALTALALAGAALALLGAAPSASAATHHPTLPAGERKAIQRTLEGFVLTAVARHHELRSWSLVTPHMRAGLTRADWAAGTPPVSPYPAEGSGLDGWKPGSV